MGNATLDVTARGSLERTARFTGRAYAEHAAYWRDRLSLLATGGATAVAPLAEWAATAGDRRVPLSAEAVRALTAITGGKELGTLVAIAAAALGVCARWSGRDVACVRLAVPGRPARRDGDGDGTVLIIERVERQDTLRGLLGRLRTTVADALRLRDYPLATAFPEQRALIEGATDVGLALGESPGGVRQALSIVVDDAARVAIRVTGAAPDAGELFARHLGRWLEQTRALDAPLAALDLLADDERALVVRAFNDTAVPYPRTATLAALFDEQVRRRGDAPALVSGDETVSYRQLDERANRLAGHLRFGLGVEPDDLVGVMMPRSIDQIVAVLAVLKAGAAYLPLDADYPAERLAWMVADARPRATIVTSDVMAALPPGAGQIFALDLQADELASRSPDALPEVAHGEHLAYVMYTSGSTGQPKGVAVPHRAVLRLLCGVDYVRLGCDEAVLHAAPLSFDASTFEIWGALLHGGRLVLLSATTPTLSEIAAAVERHAVTTMWLTAGLFHLMVDERPETLARVRQLVAGGDALSAGHVRRARERLGDGGVLVNGYGPTETTTFACCHRVGRDESLASSVPIGRPIANTQVFLLDARLQPVPAGLPGEIHVGGDGVARGYHRRPELTAERFIPDPFSATPGARLYRTGDVGRWRPDGTLEFLGRADRQVKIRGYRIEPGEIEHALLGHPDVARAVVLVRDDPAGGAKSLIACVVAREGRPAPSEEDLRVHLRRTLPAHMVPAAMRPVNGIPLTANGKVDRAALLAALPAAGAPAHVAPGNPVEAALAEVWADVLAVDRVGVDDDFFARGGDSLRAIQVLARLQDRGLTFAVHEIFAHQTIRALAPHVTRHDAARAGDPTAPFSLISDEDRRRMPAAVDDAYPLARLQAGMLFHSQEDASGTYHDVFSFHLEAPLDRAALAAAFASELARHPVLRTSFDLAGFSEPMQLVHREASLPQEELDSLEHLAPAEQDAAVQDFIARVKARPFTWERAPLMRLSLHVRGPRSFQLTLSFHHAILEAGALPPC